MPQPGTRTGRDAGGGGVRVWRREMSGSLRWGHSAYHSKESGRMVKKLSQFSLLVKSPRVSRRSFFSVLLFGAIAQLYGE